MKDVLIATHNAKKLEEIKKLLKPFKGIRVLRLDDLSTAPPAIIENGKTFRQNAVKKAVVTSKFFEGLVLADDSGLEVDALGSRPGVRSARFAGEKATDKENNTKLLKLLQKVSGKKRSARFVCDIALAYNGRLLGNYTGSVKGRLLSEARGNNGFGYDPLFVPLGYGKTFAEMGSSQKNRISHRAQALQKLKEAISKFL